MKRKVVFSLVVLVFIYSCSKKDEIIQQESSNSHISLKATSSFKGVNWADARDNYNSGWVLPSGILSGDSYSTIKSHAQTICSNFQSKIGANTVRIPINPPTVSGFWNSYKGTIDGALAQGMKVIICCWTESGSIGYVTNWNNFINMWTTVINTYGSNSNCYFEILNEPYSYSKNDLLNMYASWLSQFSSIPRSRVLAGGTGYCDNVNNIGGDSRISGCLLSQHIYPWWASYSTNGAWYNNISGRIGNYAGRTVITEYGCPMNTGLNYYGTASTDNNICFMQGVCNYMRNNGVGSCYWPGLRDGDGYSLTTLNYSTYTLSVVNTSGVNQVKWGWGN
jgi:hypothetical protein